jgi:hypothetical protein
MDLNHDACVGCGCNVWIFSELDIFALADVATRLMGIVQDFSDLVAARFFLAVGEVGAGVIPRCIVTILRPAHAGFFPAASYLLTTWY